MVVISCILQICHKMWWRVAWERGELRHATGSTETKQNPHFGLLYTVTTFLYVFIPSQLIDELTYKKWWHDYYLEQIPLTHSLPEIVNGMVGRNGALIKDCSERTPLTWFSSFHCQANNAQLNCLQKHIAFSSISLQIGVGNPLYNSDDIELDKNPSRCE